MSALSRLSFLSLLAAAPAAAMAMKLSPQPPSDWEVAQRAISMMRQGDPNYARNFLAGYLQEDWQKWVADESDVFSAYQRRRHYTRLQFMRLHCERVIDAYRS